ncbi:hypothetical protein D3C75_1003400 [compost metagenome]
MTGLLITIIPLISPILLILLVFGITMLIVRKKERRYKRANPGPDKTTKEQKG